MLQLELICLAVLICLCLICLTVIKIFKAYFDLMHYWYSEQINLEKVKWDMNKDLMNKQMQARELFGGGVLNETRWQQ
jgi:hypothetical protein